MLPASYLFRDPLVSLTVENRPHWGRLCYGLFEWSIRPVGSVQLLISIKFNGKRYRQINSSTRLTTEPVKQVKRIGVGYSALEMGAATSAQNVHFNAPAQYKKHLYFHTNDFQVQIGVVVLLSFRIFLLNVAGNIPKTSDHIPLLGKITYLCYSCKYFSRFEAQIV